MTTFRVDFLGCKVSHADAQAVRERLLADGHTEGGGDVAVLSTCCVTHEALRKSRHGRAMNLIRTDKRAAAAVGISPWRYKILAFAIGALLLSIPALIIIAIAKGIGA